MWLANVGIVYFDETVCESTGGGGHAYHKHPGWICFAGGYGNEDSMDGNWDAMARGVGCLEERGC